MSSSSCYDELEFERLYARLQHVEGNAFFCVVANSSCQDDVLEKMQELFLVGSTQVVDYREISGTRRFSSDFLQSMIGNDIRIVFLANFQLACGDLTDEEFFQTLNLSRDALAELPCALVFMMPLYFRIQLARYAPDFNSFFLSVTYLSSQENLAPDTSINDAPSEYSEAKEHLLEYYKDKYGTINKHDSKQAFIALMKTLELNASNRSLHARENARLYGEFQKLMPLYQYDDDVSESIIAFIFLSQGDYAKALEWYEKALEAREEALGKEHPDTAAACNNVALVYDHQGNYAKALEWYLKALTIKEKVLGKEHPDTADTYNNMAVVYDHQGDYARALEWYGKALTARERTFGKEHPETADTYNNMAVVYSRKGDYAKALEWFEKALAVYESVLGKEHPDTAATYNNMAVVYSHQGDNAKALEWFEKALAIKEKTLGKEHPDTAATYNNIAGVYNDQGDYARALEWFDMVLKVREKTLGKEHPDTAATRKMVQELQDKIV